MYGNKKTISFAALILFLSFTYLQTTQDRGADFEEYTGVEASRRASVRELATQAKEEKVVLPLAREVQSVEEVKSVESEAEDAQDFYDPYSEVSYTFESSSYAVKNTPHNRQSFPHAAEKNNYLIIPTDSFGRASQIGHGVGAIVKNLSTGQVGVFTGVIKLKLRDFENIQTMADNYGAELTETYAHISVGLLQFKSYEEALRAYKELREHPQTLRVNVEVLEYERGRF